MLIPVRRIVTANDDRGRSYIISDGLTPHVLESAPERGLSDLWAMFDGGPDKLTLDGADRPITLAPAAGGNTFRFFQLPPVSAGMEGQKEAREIFAKMGAKAAWTEGAKHPGMHCTQSIDYIILLKGRVKLILDDSETIMNQFDVVIQRQTNHAWQNISDEPALLMAVLIDTSFLDGAHK
ncbi:MAG: cupin domain-containing protein [Mesorhizobium sp.]|nr:cupin domain-containing protein [Mesorhizobium sp.]MCO5162236.1 cupin domain-containing protein [Mesorhizobium sp.]